MNDPFLSKGEVSADSTHPRILPFRKLQIAFLKSRSSYRAV